ncbi:DNA/RNA non-specific endonuclease [Nonlabens xiamenensis]|uniref:DNA/RNA non-specific endonuclease n=1 Tax=Nonlabens xiamenensis TaxID=2341043 RepID=UPI000F611FE9|nr:DNA/RNA non-specific endonuclease [Nonlabens xiamenensis]
MRKLIYPVIILAVLALYVYFQNQEAKRTSDQNIAQEELLHEKGKNKTQFTRNDFLPQSENQLVHHKTYSLSYNDAIEQAEWTAHVLTRNDINSKQYDRPYFEVDDLVFGESAHWRNYKNSGYDRGHLVPAADRKASFNDYKETFLTSNIAPQSHEFNAGIWNDLEQKVRYYCQAYGDIYIITGSLHEGRTSEIGSEGVSVPSHFYKIIYRQSNGKKSMLAFLIPHPSKSSSIYEHIVPVDTLEAKTGIDFFYQLPDNIEVLLESGSNRKDW